MIKNSNELLRAKNEALSRILESQVAVLIIIILFCDDVELCAKNQMKIKERYITNHRKKNIKNGIIFYIL